MIQLPLNKATSLETMPSIYGPFGGTLPINHNTVCLAGYENLSCSLLLQMNLMHLPSYMELAFPRTYITQPYYFSFQKNYPDQLFLSYFSLSLLFLNVFVFYCCYNKLLYN
jgi:hypothetical protein